MNRFVLWFGLLVLCVKGSAFSAQPIFPNLQVVLDEVNGVACQKEFQLIKEALKNNTLWAYKIFDSSAKGYVNILNGNVFSLGNFDECLEADGPVRTQYCLVDIRMKYKHENLTDLFGYKDDPYDVFQKKINPMDTLRPKRNVAHWAMCVPASCQPSALQASLQKYINNRHGNLYEIHIQQDMCSVSGEKHLLSWVDIMFCLAVLMMIIICACCSIFHRYITKNHVDKDGNITKILLCFSFQNSFNDLKRIDEASRSLDSINFMRVLIMLMIVTMHSYLNAVSGPVVNLNEYTPPDLFTYAILNSDFILDIFFFFGGFLATYNFIKRSKKRNVNGIKLIISRYFRLVPLFIMMTFFYATLYEKLGNGPLWKSIVGEEATFCKENWWTNLLVVSNYINVSHSCMLQGWYIPADIHMFIVAVVLNTIYIRKKKLGIIFIIGTLFLTFATSMYLLYIQDQVFVIMEMKLYRFRSVHRFATIHVPTHVRASSYIVGMIYAHIFIKLQNENYKLSKKCAYVISCIGVLLPVPLSFVSMSLFDPTQKHSFLHEGLYTTLSKPLFTFGIGLILLAVSLGNIIFFTKMVHWKIWTYLSKLTYGMYMCHFALQLSILGHSRTSYHMETIEISRFISDLFISAICGFVLFHIFENPINKLMKEVLYSSWKSTSTNEKNTNLPVYT